MLSDDIESLAEFLANPPAGVSLDQARAAAVCRLNGMMCDAWELERAIVPALCRQGAPAETDRVVDFQRARERLGR